MYLSIRKLNLRLHNYTTIKIHSPRILYGVISIFQGRSLEQRIIFGKYMRIDGTAEEELCTVKVHYVLYVSDIDGQRVNFDNVNTDRLNGMVFQTVKLPAGKHSFIVRMNSSATTGPMRLSSELEAGKNYFLDVHINGLKGTVQIVMVDEETGKEL